MLESYILNTNFSSFYPDPQSLMSTSVDIEDNGSINTS